MGLREWTIVLIEKEGQFNMLQYRAWNCGTACCIAGNICYAGGVDPKTLPNAYPDVEITARNLWAAEYGRDEADRLQFDEKGWGSDLDAVTPEEAVAHLNGANPVIHGYEDDIYEED